jgi:2-polyprenyl-6-methoxyphenol hydroxylase-like FAD-dependent oxidoreductase
VGGSGAGDAGRHRPAAVLRNDLYDRDPARRWADGPVVVVGDAAHPMRPHLGQGGCQALEDAAVLAAMVDLRPDLPAAFAAFESFRRRRVAGVVRESRTIGRLVNLRPPVLSAVASRARRADAGGTGDPAPGHNRRGHGLPAPRPRRRPAA